MIQITLALATIFCKHNLLTCSTYATTFGPHPIVIHLFLHCQSKSSRFHMPACTATHNHLPIHAQLACFTACSPLYNSIFYTANSPPSPSSHHASHIHLFDASPPPSPLPPNDVPNTPSKSLRLLHANSSLPVGRRRARPTGALISRRTKPSPRSRFQHSLRLVPRLRRT